MHWMLPDFIRACGDYEAITNLEHAPAQRLVIGSHLHALHGVPHLPGSIRGVTLQHDKI